MTNIRIAIRDSTDSHSVGFFDNQSGIKFKSAHLTRFLAGSASVLTLKYNSKDIDTVKSGCKLSFMYKDKPYWLNVMDVKKKGLSFELTAYSLALEANNEKKASYAATQAQSIQQYISHFDPERAFTIGINEVADKSIKLEWTGTDTLLSRLYSLANSFDAELEFVTELNSDYSLHRHVVNIYRKGNLGKVATGQPVRVGKDLKVINYADDIKNLYSAVFATGKDGLTISGLNRKVNDSDGKLLYFTDGAYLRAPQTRDIFPAVGRRSADNYLVHDLGSTEYNSKEALYGYMLSELKKVSQPKVTYTVEGSVNGDIGDTKTLIDDKYYGQPLYVQGRISEMAEDIITGKVIETTLTNYERKQSQVSDDLRKRAEELAKEAMPYTLELSTSAGTAFKNGTGNSLITPTLKRGLETISEASFVWTMNGTSTTASTYTVTGAAVTGTAVVKAEAVLAGKVVASTEITFTNVSDGRDGRNGVAGKDGVGIRTTTITYGQSTSGTVQPTTWTSQVPSIPDGQFLWTKTVWTYTDNTSEMGYSVAKMGEAGPKGEDGAVNITCGFTQGFSDSFTAINAGVGAITALSDGWAKFKYTNSTTSVKRVEFWLPKPPGLTENQLYTFVHEFRNNASSSGLVSYHVQDNASAFWGNDSGNAQVSVSDGVKRFQRMVYLSQNTLDRATRLVTVNINIPAGSTLDVEIRMACYVGSYSGAYIPYQGGKTGSKGADGANAYFFVAYADSPDGSSGFSLTDTSKRYMGHYSSNSPTQSQSYASYKWVDRANVAATFVQSVTPINPPAGSRWKYTGSTVITANSSTIRPSEQYLFIGARWVKDVITSDNLQIKDQFINGPMIKNGAVTVDKLNVGNLSAISANLGSVNAGKMLLQRSFGAGSSAVPAYNYPAFKTGLFVDNYGLIVNGGPVQKFTSEATASDMPVVAVTSGEVRFLRANLTDNIEEVLHNGLADPDFGYIQFGRDSSGKNALIIEANGQVYLKGENYTDWARSTVNSSVRWKVQGNLVIVDYDVTFPTGGTKHIVTVPTKYVPKALMLTAKAWHTFLDRDRNAQLNADGGLHILATDANQRYCGQILWSY